jgi:hypothetical protein
MAKNLTDIHVNSERQIFGSPNRNVLPSANNINSTYHQLEAIRVCWKYCCMEVTKTSGELKCQILPPFFFFPSEELFFSLCKAGDSN